MSNRTCIVQTSFWHFIILSELLSCLSKAKWYGFSIKNFFLQNIPRITLKYAAFSMGNTHKRGILVWKPGNLLPIRFHQDMITHATNFNKIINIL